MTIPRWRSEPIGELALRLLVTGGAGFIGSNFVRYVLAQGEVSSLANLDALTYAGNLASLVGVVDDPRYRSVHGDVCDGALVSRFVADADAVVHLAAESHVDRSIDQPRTFLETNVVGAGVVFEACRRAEVERVVHISTDHVGRRRTRDELLGDRASARS